MGIGNGFEKMGPKCAQAHLKRARKLGCGLPMMQRERPIRKQILRARA